MTSNDQWVERDESPERDLPLSLLRAIDACVWIEDAELGYERLEALLEAVVPVGGEHHVAKPPPRLKARLDKARIPVSVKAELIHVNNLPRAELLRVWPALRDLLYEWNDLFADHEKLLGHVLLAHDGHASVRRRSVERLAQTHVQLHRGMA